MSNIAKTEPECLSLGHPIGKIQIELYSAEDNREILITLTRK